MSCENGHANASGLPELPVRNPRTGQADYHIHPASADEIAARCRDLRAAQGAWSARTVEQRADVLRAWADAIRARGAEIIAALSADTGRRAISVIEAGGVPQTIARWCDTGPAMIAGAQAGEHPTQHPTIHFRTHLVPLQLVGVISPWNFPLTLSLIDAVPALLAGCAVVIKPSEVTPRFAAPLRESIAAVPELAGVLAVFDGDGHTGQALIDAVDAICFTGSVATGRKVGAQAAANFIPAFLELGGKDPAIVLASADVNSAASALLRGSIANVGQACQSIERIYVDRTIYQPFVDTLVAQAQQVALNAQDIRKGHLGPVIFQKQAGIIQTQLDDARAKGAVIHTGGNIEVIDGGAYCRPTVITDVTGDMKVLTEETFGPILPVTPFDTVEEAIGLANDSIYGLSGAVFAGTLDEAEAVGRRLQVGAVSLNDAALTSMVWEAEKNSFKLSGLGASRMGPSGLLRFFRKQALIRQSGTPSPITALAEENMP